MTDEEFKEMERRVRRLEQMQEEKFRQKVNEQPCMWDSMPETSPGSGMKIAGLVCPCPKCSPRC